MSLTREFVSILIDPFRIILLLGLFYTMKRTQQVTGTWLPLLAGCVFVAVLIPTTLGLNHTFSPWRQVALGLVANVILLGLILGLWHLYERWRGNPPPEV